jgi:hypothetical protein
LKNISTASAFGMGPFRHHYEHTNNLLLFLLFYSAAAYRPVAEASIPLILITHNNLGFNPTHSCPIPYCCRIQDAHPISGPLVRGGSF